MTIEDDIAEFGDTPDRIRRKLLQARDEFVDSTLGKPDVVILAKRTADYVIGCDVAQLDGVRIESGPTELRAVVPFALLEWGPFVPPKATEGAES